jgi:hypothetical protein
MRRTLACTILLGTTLAIGATVSPAGAVTDTEPPRITFVPNPLTPPPGPSGWYRDLSPFDTLPYVVDFVDPSGLRVVGCRGLLEFSYGPPVLLGTTFGYSAGVNADGVHTLDCSATDQLGNTGVGVGSTPMPVTIRIDRTPPTVTCRQTPYVKRGHRVRLRASVQDATSGPVSDRVQTVFVATRVGRFTAPVAGADVAGNQTVVACPYVVVRRGHH